MEKVVRKLRSQQMPPGGHKLPDTGRTQARSSRGWKATWMPGAAQPRRSGPCRPASAEPQGIRQRGARPARHRASIPPTLLPRDDTREGFDNIAAALQVTPSFLDQYISAARTVAVQAMGNKDALPGGHHLSSPPRRARSIFHEDGLPLGTRGGFGVDHNFPADGEYVLNIANMAQALWVYNMEFENTLVVTLDGKLVYETTIGGEDDMKAIDQKQDPAVEAINARLKNIRFKATAGIAPRRRGVPRIAVSRSPKTACRCYVPGGGQDRVLRVTCLRDPRPVQRHRRQPDAEPRAHLQRCYPKSGRRGGARARERSSATSRGAPSAVR